MKRNLIIIFISVLVICYFYKSIKMREMPLISVIIPTYNRYENLHQSIRSVLDGTYKNIEIIVVNDKSTDIRYYDGSLEKYSSSNVKVIHLDENMRQKYQTTSAQGATRQIGVEIAKGEYIAFLDDDDFYLPNKLEIQLKEMMKNNKLFSTTNMLKVKHKSIDKDKLDIDIISPYHTQVLPSVFTFELINQTNYINTSTTLIHRSLIEKAGKMEPIKYEDWVYWLKILKHSDCLYIPEPLVYYTVNNDKNYVI